MIGLALKNYPKMTLWMSKSIHWIQRYHEVSWFVQSQSITTGLALKNYPKMTLWLSKSVHWIKRYSDIYFEVSLFVHKQLIVLHYWIGLEKVPQNDPLSVQIHPLDQKIQWSQWLHTAVTVITIFSYKSFSLIRPDFSIKTSPLYLLENLCQPQSLGDWVLCMIFNLTSSTNQKEKHPAVFTSVYSKFILHVQFH